MPSFVKDLKLTSDTYHLSNKAIHLISRLKMPLVMSLMVSYFVLSFFSHEISWMRSGTEFSQFLRLFLPTLDLNNNIVAIKCYSIVIENIRNLTYFECLVLLCFYKDENQLIRVRF